MTMEADTQEGTDADVRAHPMGVEVDGRPVRSVEVGSVMPFPDAVPDKAQALKVLEEAAEVYGAWQRWVGSGGGVCEGGMTGYFGTDEIADEISDCIQACVNLASALGIRAVPMAACEARNRARGRYGEDA